MNEIKTTVYVSFSYGAWNIKFKRKFKLPFTPFYDLQLDCSNSRMENIIELKNNQYCVTQICYNPEKKCFYVDVHNYWKRPVRDDVVDDTIEMFRKTGWKRIDETSIIELKKLMNRNHEKGM